MKNSQRRVSARARREEAPVVEPELLDAGLLRKHLRAGVTESVQLDNQHDVNVEGAELESAVSDAYEPGVRRARARLARRTEPRKS
jgi:hypothetical protein